jgi:nitrogen-specific signal transduction histidine kinase/CheY-like chemotaxis protein
VSTAQIVYERGAAVVATGIDVTPRRRLEARMQQARQLESVGRLAGGVAHDFNNLLMVIGGETECLLDALPPSSPLRGSLESIARASERAASLTEQLLAFGRRQFLIARPTSVNEVVLDLEAALRRDGVGVALRLATGLPPVHVDRARLDRVLANLVSNAREAMGRAPGSDAALLTMSTDLVQVDDAMREGRPWLPGGAWVRLQVADNGPGIPTDILPHVFEPFFSTKNGGPATGLGLSTVYGIVKQSDGFVWVDSDPGAGARVTILLPPAEATLAPVPVEPAPASDAPRVLLVEDEDGVRALLTNVLRREGFVVSSAATAEAALALAARQPFDVLLTDVVLPGMRGPDLAARLTGQLSHLRVLFMSGYTGEAILDSVGSAAPSAFIQKPFGSRALVARLRALLNGG